jgi:hydrogenase nickel incorporation protein HypA/HybF
MHEMSVAQSLIDIIKEEMSTHEASTLRSVRLHIGRLSAVVPEALSFCFDVMTSGTEMEGARLIMDMIPIAGACEVCGNEFEIEDYAVCCPACGGTEIETTGGQELRVVEIEVG